jgi:hypothetical protein
MEGGSADCLQVWRRTFGTAWTSPQVVLFFPRPPLPGGLGKEVRDVEKMMDDRTARAFLFERKVTLDTTLVSILQSLARYPNTGQIAQWLKNQEGRPLGEVVGQIRQTLPLTGRVAALSPWVLRPLATPVREEDTSWL